MKGVGEKSPRKEYRPVLDSVGFYNLKAFGDWETLPIRRLNLIFGKNSSGKSSIFHSLLWIRDVLFNKNLNITTPERSGDFVDLGGLEQFVHFKKKKEKKIGFRFRILVPEKRLHRDIFLLELQNNSKIQKKVSSLRASELSKALKEISPGNSLHEATLEVVFDLKGIFGKKNRGIKKIEITPHVTLSLGKTVVIMYEAQTRHGKMAKTSAEIYEENTNASSARLNPQIFDVLKEMTKKMTEVYKFLGYNFDQLDFGPKKNSDHRGMIKVNYPFSLSSLSAGDNGVAIFPCCKGPGKWWKDRLHPGDYCSGEITDVGKPIPNVGMEMLKAEYALLIGSLSSSIKEATETFFRDINYLAAYRNYPEREISQKGLLKLRGLDPYGNDSYRDIFENRNFLKRINRACEMLHADFCFVIDKTASNQTGMRLEIKNLHSGLNLSFRDIGFGWSQVLPVIVEIVQGLHSALFVEQPELHLHPNNQSQLMDVVLENMGKDKGPFRPIFLELHSEQMALRLLRRIKENGGYFRPNKLNPDDFVINYVMKEKEGSKIRRLAISDHGTMEDPWPGGFFESALKDF